MNVFAQVSYVEFEYYWFCVFFKWSLMQVLIMKKKKECNVFLIERNEMIVLNNNIIIVWNIDKKDNQHILESLISLMLSSYVLFQR